MKCKKVERLLPLYVSEDLTEGEKALVNEHLSSCPDCLEKVNDFRKDAERIASLREDRPIRDEADFFENVLEKIAAGDIRSDRPSLVWLPLAAAAAVVLFVGLAVLMGVFSPSGDPADLVDGGEPVIDSKIIHPVDVKKSVFEYTVPNRFDRVRLLDKDDEPRPREADF